VAAALAALKNNTSGFDYLGLDEAGAKELVTALDSAVEQHHIVAADAYYDSRMKESASPAMCKGDYIIISDRVKCAFSGFPVYLAHEGSHLADFYAKRWQTNGDSDVFTSERRAFNFQHGFASRMNITDQYRPDQWIRENYLYKGVK
jgi:hypothetical protein